MSRPEQLTEVHRIRKLRNLLADNEILLFELRSHQRRFEKLLSKRKIEISRKLP